MSMSTTGSTRTSRIAAVGAAAVIAALALTGCADSGGDAPAERTSTAPSASRTPAARATPTPTATAAASKDLSFTDGADLSADMLPAFGIEMSGLPEWEQTGEDQTKGTREFTRSDGAVATVTQEHLTGLDPTQDDRAATEQLFASSEVPIERLEPQLLPTYTGGTADFLSFGGHTTDGAWTATVARVFTKPEAALIVSVRAPSQEALVPDLHEVLVHAKVVLTPR